MVFKNKNGFPSFIFLHVFCLLTSPFYHLWWLSRLWDKNSFWKNWNESFLSTSERFHCLLLMLKVSIIRSNICSKETIKLSFIYSVISIICFFQVHVWVTSGFEYYKYQFRLTLRIKWKMLNFISNEWAS